MFLCGIFARSPHAEKPMPKLIQCTGRGTGRVRLHRENLGKPQETHNEAMI